MNQMIKFYSIQARLCLPRRGEPAARDYVIAGIVRGAKPTPKKEKMFRFTLRSIIIEAIS